MNTAIRNLPLSELEAGLDEIRRAPKHEGVVEFIVRRPKSGEREIIERGELDPMVGLVGDNWSTRGCRLTADGGAHPKMQLNIMSSRVIGLVAQTRERWPLAGDQLFVDLDLSAENLPPGTRLAIGTAVIEVTDQPHTGCAKFVERFGVDATKFVNSPVGERLQLRGINARVVQAGSVSVGDFVRRMSSGPDPEADPARG
jgi:hypothetical protein